MTSVATPTKTFGFPWQKVLSSNPGKALSNPDNVPLFTPYPIRGAILKNRTVVSPMCTYSSEDGFATDWHVVHLTQFALGGAALIFCEATAVVPEGRITPYCTGIWKDEHISGWKRVTDNIHAYGGLAGMQLAHAGRKASTYPPFYPTDSQRKIVPKSEGGWDVVGPSPVPFVPDGVPPHELTVQEIKESVNHWVAAAKRSVEAGFDVIEIHSAHGYLLSSFNSPLSNKRTDEYGGSFEGRTKYLLEVVAAVREAFPEIPLFVRISSIDGPEDGWVLADTVRLAKLLKEAGVDVVDCSSGGVAFGNKGVSPLGNYQVPYAEAVKKAGVPSMAVGLITEPTAANEILVEGKADLIALGRAFLHNPRWTTDAGAKLGVVVEPAKQYHWTYKGLPPTQFVQPDLKN